MGECAKCGVENDGKDVRIYYGNKKSESSQSYTSGKGTKVVTTSVITTTNYTVGGWDDVSICDRCTKKHSLAGGWVNALWSVPLALFLIAVGAMMVVGIISDYRKALEASPISSIIGQIIFIVFLIAIVTRVAVVSLSRLVKPLNDTSRSAIARKIMVKLRAGEYNTFWTQAELDKLKIS